MRKAIAGVLIIAFMALMALSAPWTAPHDPHTMSLATRLHGPSSVHPLGQDENGSDVLSKVMFGARVSLGVAWSVVLVSALLGFPRIPDRAGICGHARTLARQHDLRFMFHIVDQFRTPRTR